MSDTVNEEPYRYEFEGIWDDPPIIEEMDSNQIDIWNGPYINAIDLDTIIWHDIRKEPDDLPEKGQRVVVIKNDEYIIAFLREDGVWTTDGHNAFEGVIAWYFIPDFEQWHK